MSVPAIDPIIANAMVAAIGTADVFSKVKSDRLKPFDEEGALRRRSHTPEFDTT
jgi:hypothetical protein